MKISETLEQPVTEPRGPEKLPHTILVAEYDRDLRKLLAAVLERRYTHVEFVDTSDQLLERLGSGNFDAVVAEKELPNISGAITKLRSPGSLNNVPVILLKLSRGTSEEEKVVMESNNTALFLKPFDPKDLYTTIEKMIEEKKPE